MKTGITGATGQLGQLVVAHLTKKVSAHTLVALVRTPEKATSLGIEARAFDYNNPSASALQGIDKLLLISGNEMGSRKQQHASIIQAAKEAGVKWIVYTSLLQADTSSISLAEDHLDTEEVLKASGIPYTILRNGWYNENYENSIAGGITAGVIAGSAGEGKISSAARTDFAEAAAVVLTSHGHQGKVYELAGDDAYTLAELAAELSKQSGKTISYSDMPEAAYAEVLKSIGVPEGFAPVLASWDTGIAKNNLYNSGKQLHALIGRPTTTIAATISAILSRVS